MSIQLRRKVYPAISKLFTALFILTLSVMNLFAQEMRDENMQAAAQSPSLEVIVRPKVEYKAEGLINPFRSPLEKSVVVAPIKGPEGVQAEVKPLPPLTVQGLIWGGNFPQAIINDKVVKIGDVIVEGVNISAIDKDGIEVMFEGRRYRLPSPASAKEHPKPGSIAK